MRGYYRYRPDCARCERLTTRGLRLLEVLEFVRESSVRETDGYLTIEPEAVDMMIDAVNEHRVACGLPEVAEDEWP